MSRYIKIFAVTIVSIIFITHFIIDLSVVDGSSMNPTIKDGEVIAVLKVGSVQRGDIVTLSLEDENHLIKRIVAVPGDHLKIENGELYINGVISNDFSSPSHYKKWNGLEVRLNEDEYYVMGDNRDYSLDSRAYGVMNIDDITGKVVFHFY